MRVGRLFGRRGVRRLRGRERLLGSGIAQAKKPTLILPDKDADGLSSGAILHHTLTSLGLPQSLISVYFPPKGSNIHDDSTREVISTSPPPSYVFVLDQGSRKTRPLINTPHTCLIIDHHFAEEGGFPQDADYVTAHDCPPVATSSLLTYHICSPLNPDTHGKISWLAVLGTHGDLGTTLKWLPPFPDMTATFKAHSKKSINDAVSRVNAPRRSAAYNISAAWDAVLAAETPSALVANEALIAAGAEVREETERWAHVPPRFSKDATIAVLTINSAAQIHPLIATRWAGFLKSDKLEVVMCANEGYLPGMVNFSCRVARNARAREGEDKVDIIRKLEGLVEGDEGLRERLGESFARGHKEASGGIVGRDVWEELYRVMGVGENVRGKKEGKEKEKKVVQKNTLANYFVKAS
ncbi:DHH phosphoesterase [Periconia macrospinosa]|uniref:DHH phosphoesterase n=1 Tax=Periconia macrospinosa TaxID=97972 RepID=A0A2V1EDF4_9PLEO|nr:DHH phosphoesterase [Periconia macrospinosa]